MVDQTAGLEIHQFPCLSDNYGVLIRDGERVVVASIDAPSAADVKAALAAKGWKLTHILTTHHHHDHTDGNLELKRDTGCHIIGPLGEAQKIPGIDEAVAEGDTFKWGSFDVTVIETPGHTKGHIIYWMPAAKVAFVGDTLFALGCGRVFEGTMEMMHLTLETLAQLPGETLVYCGHEYTQANAKFALTVDPDNPVLRERAQTVADLRKGGRYTLPTTLALESATNPFLRVDNPGVMAAMGMQDADPSAVFAAMRERKNTFA